MTSTSAAYRAQRARAMAYGTWRPWADDPEPVREHVRQLRECGASYEAIGKAAGVATMAVHALMNGGGRVRAETAEALMGLTPQRLDLARVPAGARSCASGAWSPWATPTAGSPGRWAAISRRCSGSPAVTWPRPPRACRATWGAFTRPGGTRGRPSGPRASGWPLRLPGGALRARAGPRVPAWTTPALTSPATSRRRPGARPRGPASRRRTRWGASGQLRAAAA